MKLNKELNEVQKNVDYEIAKIIKNSSDEEKGIMRFIANHVSLDVNVLYSECDNLYEVNDSKQDLSKKLLKFVKENKYEFKHFSKIAEDIINKKGY